MPQGWNNWHWNRSQSKSQRRPRPNQDKTKAEQTDGTKFPAYDTSSLPSSSTSSGSSSILQGDQVIDLLKRIAGKDEEAMKEVQKLIPAAEEEAENDILRQQQKMLNQIRKLQVKLGKKEALILQKD